MYLIYYFFKFNDKKLLFLLKNFALIKFKCLFIDKINFRFNFYTGYIKCVWNNLYNL